MFYMDGIMLVKLVFLFFFFFLKAGEANHLGFCISFVRCVTDLAAKKTKKNKNEPQNMAVPCNYGESFSPNTLSPKNYLSEKFKHNIALSFLEEYIQCHSQNVPATMTILFLHDLTPKERPDHRLKHRFLVGR